MKFEYKDEDFNHQFREIEKIYKDSPAICDTTMNKLNHYLDAVINKIKSTKSRTKKKKLM